MVTSTRLEGGIDDQGKDYVVLMPSQGFARLAELIDGALESHEGFGISVEGRASIFFRLGMVVDYRVSACDDGSLVVSLSKDTMRTLGDMMRPLCVPHGDVDHVHFDVCGDHTKPYIQTLVFERLDG